MPKNTFKLRAPEIVFKIFGNSCPSRGDTKFRDINNYYCGFTASELIPGTHVKLRGELKLTQPEFR